MEDLCQVRDASSRRRREQGDGKGRRGNRRKPAACWDAENPKTSNDARRKRARKAEIVPGSWVVEAVAADRGACMECGACARNCEPQAIEVRSGVGCAAGVLVSWLSGASGG